MTVQLGLNTFGDVGTGPDGRSLSHAQVIRNVIHEGILADQVGIDFFGVGEHHRADYAISSPEVVLAAIGSRTSRIRLGSAATVLTSDDPVRLYQRFATLSAATNGRVEIVVGRGWFAEPLALFGFERADYDALFEEKVALLCLLIRQQRVTWRGRWRSPLTGQTVFPPLETGPPRTWVAVGATPDSALRAARHDLCLMIAAIGGPASRLKPLADIYRAGCDRLGRAARDVGVHSIGYVAETDARACDEFWPCYKALRDRVGSERGWPPFDRVNFESEIARGSLYVGSSETVARKIVGALKILGATRFDMRYCAGALSHDRMMHSIERYGTKVAPIVRDLLC